MNIDDGRGNGKGALTPPLEGLSLGERKTRVREATGKPPAVSDKRKLIRILERKGAELATEITTAAEKPKRAPRSRGRARAEVAAKGPIIQGPKSGKLPGLSPGTRLVRNYKGKRITVLVLERGRFEYNDKTYHSLSAIANEISGTHCNGLAWFGLRKRAKKAKPS